MIITTRSRQWLVTAYANSKQRYKGKDCCRLQDGEIYSNGSRANVWHPLQNFTKLASLRWTWRRTGSPEKGCPKPVLTDDDKAFIKELVLSLSPWDLSWKFILRIGDLFFMSSTIYCEQYGWLYFNILHIFLSERGSWLFTITSLIKSRTFYSFFAVVRYSPPSCISTLVYWPNAENQAKVFSFPHAGCW